jgi:hypothetical protein
MLKFMSNLTEGDFAPASNVHYSIIMGALFWFGNIFFAQDCCPSLTQLNLIPFYANSVPPARRHAILDGAFFGAGGLTPRIFH